jgi:O-antigen/teichoic acid export membrane protein
MKEKIIKILRKLQKYTKTDMVYLAKGTFWLFFSKIGLALISFASMLAFANWLPKESFGTYQFILSTISILAISTLPGINTAIVKSIAQKKEGVLQAAVKERIKWGYLGSLLALVLSLWYFLHDNNILTIAFLLTAVFLPFKAAFNTFEAFWSSRKRFDLRAKYSLIVAGISTSLTILTIYLTNNILIIFAVFLISYTFLNWFFYSKTKRQTINNEQDPEAISFGKNLTFITGLQVIATYLDKIIIWHFLGAVPVAIYSFAQKPIDKVKTFLPISLLALPKLGEGKMGPERKKGITRKFLLLFLAFVPAAITMTWLAPFLYRLFFPQYMESVPFFQAMSILIAFCPFLLLNSVLISEIKKRALYTINIAAPLLKVTLFLTLIPYFGIWGIVIALLTAETVKIILTLIFYLGLGQTKPGSWSKS